MVIAGEGPPGGGVTPGSCREGSGSGVAVGAVGHRKRGTRRGMHRIIRSVVIGSVAVGVSAALRSSEVVAARGSGVTEGASDGGVQAGEREASVVVIEGGVGPIDGVVAGIASLGEIRSDVIGDSAAECSGALPVSSMAGIASGAVQTVVVADVALIAVGGRARGGHLVIAG